jgi:hypothetical protein
MARIVFAMFLVCLLAGVASADKVHQFVGDGARDSREGGEDWSNAVPIPSLPYSDSGATCDNHWDVDFSCGFTYGISPDVFYSYTACADGTVTVDLCGSGYDTEVAVFNASLVEVACNDDFCGLQSTTSFNATAGAFYYIVVSGYYGSCGSYVINVTGPDCSARGACCAADGTCSVTTQSGCQGTYQGDDTSCSPNPCEPPVPTNNVNWGFIKSQYR